MTGLPTAEEMLAHALAAVEQADRELSAARDWLASDWRPVGSEMTDAQAEARATARTAIGAAKKALTPGGDALRTAGGTS